MRLDIIASTLRDDALLTTVKRLTALEKKIQYRFLCYLSEIDRRKLYAVEGYPSLFAFLTDYLGYSESSALKRSQIVRKAIELPQLYYAIEYGKLSLSAASRLCPYLSAENFEALVGECERKPVREVEKILVKYFPKENVNDSVTQKVAPLSIDQVSVRFTASTEFAAKLEKARALLAHKYPQGKIADTLSDALDALLKSFEPRKRRGPSKRTAGAVLDSRYIPRGIRHEVRERDDKQCMFVSASGHRCRATRFLHIDHIEPWALGGSSHDSQNLQLLCSTHNRLRAQLTFPEASPPGERRDRWNSPIVFAPTGRD